jgi:hypothetical protein
VGIGFGVDLDLGMKKGADPEGSGAREAAFG